MKTATRTQATKILPFALVRTGGGSIAHFDKLCCKKTMILLDQLFAIDQEIMSKREEVSYSLRQVLKSVSVNRTKKVLINGRRLLYNQKQVGDEKMKLILSLMGPDDKSFLIDYLECLNRKEQLLTSIQSTYEEETENNFSNLIELFTKDNLRKGLVLSTSSLAAKIDKIKKVSWSNIRKKDHQTVLGLLKYLTRMYCKTSPFSTFTHLSSAKIKKGKNEFLNGAIENQAMKSHIRLNNFLWAYIRTLLTVSKKTNRFFNIQLNPTLKKEDGKYLFLVNHLNEESFQRIPVNPFLDFIIAEIDKSEKNHTLNSIIAHLVKQEFIEAEPDQIAAYLDQLIQYGFIEYNFGISGVDTEWDKALVDLLLPLKESYKYFPELIDALRHLRKLSESYAILDSKKREETLNEAHDCIRKICLKIHEDADLPEEERRSNQEVYEENLKEWKAERKNEKEGAKVVSEGASADTMVMEEDNRKDETFTLKSNTRFYFEPKQIFYEDVTLSNDFKLSKDLLEPVVKKINRTLNDLFLYEAYSYEQRRMDQFFKSYYTKGSAIDLLNFYEDYFREVKKPIDDFKGEKNKKIKELQNQLVEIDPEEQVVEVKRINEQIEQLESLGLPDEFKVQKNQQRKEVQKKWADRIKNEFSVEENPTIIEIDSEKIHAISNEMSSEFLPTQHHHSIGTFVQFYLDDSSGTQKLMCVLNNSFAGYGKLASRFLHILDKDFLSSIRTYNSDHQPEGTCYIEDMDASVFNANLHPPLLPRELRMPNGNNSLPRDAQIPVNNMHVKWIDGELGLFDKTTDKRLLVFDLGFQGHRGRSQLFQLAEKFTGTKLLFISPLLDNVGHPKNEAQAEETGKENDGQKVIAKPSILRLPRIVLDESIVLRRGSWVVPRSRLPFKEPGESNAEYFIRINTWRNRLKLPDEVFVNVFAQHQKILKNKGGQAQLSRDDYKPQYINFTNPYTVILFEKIIKKVPVSLRIVEMLPNSNQVLKFGNERKVSEFLIQWYNYAS